MFDDGHPRNHQAQAMNGFISRDGIRPLEFLETGRMELQKYGVEVACRRIVSAEQKEDLFFVKSDDGREYSCKKLVLATGIVDKLPDIPGIEEYVGRSAFHCPYCDGWENRDKKISVIGDVRGGTALAMNLQNWSDEVSVLQHGKYQIDDKDLKRLKKRAITVYPQKIKALEGKNGFIKKILFQDGTSILCDALFFSFGYTQHSELAEMLGCEFSEHGLVKTNKLQMTNIPGLYAVGDASRDMQLVIVAASEGTKAGVAIHTALMTGK